MRLSARAEAILAGESSSARCWTVEHEIQVGRVFGAACPSASTGAKSQSPTVRGVIVPYPSRRSRTPLLTRLWVLVNVPRAQALCAAVNETASRADCDVEPL